jgi:site-specific DNA recombinase
MTLRRPRAASSDCPLGDEGPLAGWVRRSDVAPASAKSVPGGLRFAFYGRVSTEDHQDPETSRAWQVLRAEGITSGFGRIVAEFFDVGHSRVLPWARRPPAPPVGGAQ